MHRQALFALLAVLAILCCPARANFVVDSFFDISHGVIMDPSTDSISINVGHESSSAGGLITDAVLAVNVQDTIPTELPVEIFAHGGGSSSQYDPDWWVESFFDVSYKYDIPPIPPDSFFDVSFDFDLPSGAGSPLLSQLPDVFHIDSFFDIRACCTMILEPNLWIR